MDDGQMNERRIKSEQFGRVIAVGNASTIHHSAQQSKPFLESGDNFKLIMSFATLLNGWSKNLLQYMMMILELQSM